MDDEVQASRIAMNREALVMEVMVVMIVVMIMTMIMMTRKEMEGVETGTMNREVGVMMKIKTVMRTYMEK